MGPFPWESDTQVIKDPDSVRLGSQCREEMPRGAEDWLTRGPSRQTEEDSHMGKSVCTALGAARSSLGDGALGVEG